MNTHRNTYNGCLNLATDVVLDEIGVRLFAELFARDIARFDVRLLLRDSSFNRTSSSSSSSSSSIDFR
jgi:hypothetical protein